jgi:transmembrane 9 superfamily member 3
MQARTRGTRSAPLILRMVRQETYEYYSLPYCRGPKQQISHAHETIGEALLGVELQFSGLDIRFKENVERTPFCSITLGEHAMRAFSFAVRNHYWYQMFLDDLPIWGNVGDFGSDVSTENPSASATPHVFTHKHFDIGYNGDQIVDVTLTCDERMQLSLESRIDFTYSVSWRETDVEFSKRFDKYLDPTFFQHHVRSGCMQLTLCVSWCDGVMV